MNKLSQFFSRKKKEPPKQDFSIHESLFGNWFYHIALNNVPLCGAKNTMRRQLSLKSWGMRSPHIGERYCKVCEKIWIEGPEVLKV